MSRNIGVSYAGVTAGLLVVIVLSGLCWGSQNGPGQNNQALHAICVLVWALSGALLAVTQIVFLVIALRMNADEDEARINLLRLVVFVFAGVILLAIVVFVFALSQMPS